MGFHTKTYSHLLDQFRPTTISLTLCASIYFPQLSSTSKGSELVITCLIDFYFQFPQINDYKKNYNNTPFLCKQLFIISLFLWHYDHTFFRLSINICLFFLFSFFFFFLWKHLLTLANEYVLSSFNSTASFGDFLFFWVKRDELRLR